MENDMQNPSSAITSRTIIWDPPFPSKEEKLDYAHIVIKNKSDCVSDVLAYVGELQKNEKNIHLKEVWGYEKDEENNYFIRYKPAKGRWEVKYKDKVIEVIVSYRTDSIKKHRDGPTMYYEVHLYSKEGYDFLDKFIHKARKYANPKSSKEKIVCKRFTAGSYWSTFAKQAKRNIETLFLPEGKQKELLDDISEFLNAQKEYRDFGMPYKRVYLLSGIAGTGKTSLVFSLACHFSLNLSIFPFDSNASDGTFNHAITSLDNDNILLLEDIDQGIGRDKVSLSGITNVLDGVNHRDRMIVFMTTNYPEKLDRVLLRPGRVDIHIKFQYATEYQIKQMLLYYFPIQCKVDNIENEDKEKDKKTKKELKNRTEIICKNLARKQITTAVLSEFLFHHRKSTNILDEIETNYEEIVNKIHGEKDFQNIYL